jgi:hypothetical protein
MNTEIEAGTEDEVDEGVTEIELDRASAQALYGMNSMGINPLRWERARTDILFEDLVEELHGTRQQVISCPFHGRDSKPSFHLYRRTNDAYCFGCKPGANYYDSIRFVAAKLEMTHVKSLLWLEKHYNLPHIADALDDYTDEESEEVSITFDDLSGPYIFRASTDIQATKDVELAMDYLKIYFQAKKATETGDPLPLARVLGRDIIKKILKYKR